MTECVCQYVNTYTRLASYVYMGLGRPRESASGVSTDQTLVNDFFINLCQQLQFKTDL